MGENGKYTNLRMEKRMWWSLWILFYELTTRSKSEVSELNIFEIFEIFCVYCVCLLWQEVSYDSSCYWIYVSVGIVYYVYRESLSLNWKIGKRKCLKTSPESVQLLGRFRKIFQLYLFESIVRFPFKVNYYIKKCPVWIHLWIPIDCG